ncbi:hypothetical protein [Aurantiacibacter odishensis]|uniref:hypothetical protein n=1 Tax=Aurantiacibacter odishensis TaxID=1155476 RepID=UPI001F0CB996|nr:hypothetical protein [Aurantiacibacter odishensis]
MIQRAAVVIAVIIQIGATFLPALGIGEEIGSRSDATRTLVTPAGWAFAIWGPLFAGTVAFAIYQALPGQRRDDLLNAIAWPAAGAFLGNGLWAIYTQLHALTALSVVIIVFTLVCLLTVYRRLVALRREFVTVERWLVMLPLSALAAWLTAATIVNISASLKYHGVAFEQANMVLAAAVVLVGGIIAALAVGRGRGNPVYAAVFLWALTAIYAAGGQVAPPVAYATVVSGVLVIATTLFRLRDVGNRRHWLG